jgi:crotonobetainyl-CoA:carnitine CoA-transferase CaiB-like acyl-CoA transferase
MTSISNFGQTGPYRDWRAQDIVIYAMGGAMNITGLPDREPLRLALNLMAYQGGNVAATATMMGVLGASRLRTGQHIDVALLEVHAGCIDRRTTSLLGYQYTGEPGYHEEPTGIGVYPVGVIPCQGEDTWLVIAVATDAEWQRLYHALGNPTWATAKKFATQHGRLQHQDELDRHLAAWTALQDARTAMEHLQAHGVAAGMVFSEPEAYADPHLQARGFFETVTHRECGTHHYPGMLWKMSKTPGSTRSAACCLGEHNAYVYRELLGMSDAEVTRLRQEGHIGDSYIGV